MAISFGEIADKYITKKGLEDLTEADEIEIASEICGERVNKYVAKYIIYKYTWQHHTRTSEYGSYIDEDKLEIFNNLLEIPFSKFFEYFLKSHYKFNTEESEDIINYIVNNKIRIKSKLFIDWLSNPSIPDEIKYYNTRRTINSFMTFMMYLDDPEILIEYIRNHEIYSKMKALRRHLNKIKRARDIELKLNEELNRYKLKSKHIIKFLEIRNDILDLDGDHNLYIKILLHFVEDLQQLKDYITNSNYKNKNDYLNYIDFIIEVRTIENKLDQMEKDIMDGKSINVNKSTEKEIELSKFMDRSYMKYDDFILMNNHIL